MTVDEFVSAEVLPQFWPVVSLIRGRMKAVAPGVQELISYGIPAYKGKKILAVISPTKVDVTFSFSRGTQFDDKFGLLRGVGKVSRHYKIKSVNTANLEALDYYISEALRLDRL
jgi:hypothetical protein